MRVLDYLFLPPEITPFERRYLARLNRIALIFFYLHVPVFMAIATTAGTGPFLALALAAAVLAGPTAAFFTFANPRALSVVYGITAMLMGGLLVHFGQGPVQIEMHFYFFALLAMLCMFANPTVNVAAAVTVAIHHLLLFIFLPSSVFNYDAEWWVVAVHAAFVVLETIAACYISREFFDNVIGLEKIVEARTATIREQQRDMKLILDNVAQGLITIDLKGRIAGGGSRALHEWFGEPAADETFGAWMGRFDGKFGEWFDLALESVTDGMLPREVALAQLPRSITDGDRTFTVHYRLIEEDAGAGAPDPDGERRAVERPEAPASREKMLIMVTDVTEQLAKEARERRQAELLELFQHITRDKAGFLEFLSEAEDLMAALTEGQYTDLDHLKRLIHTLKGNSAIFGMRTFSEICHVIESQIADEGMAPTVEDIARVEGAWADIRKDLQQILGDRDQAAILLDDRDYEAILQAVVDDVDRGAVRRMIESWRLEPTARRLQLIEQQLRGLAERMGKSNVRVVLEPNDIRFDSEHFAPFWSAFIHVLRNTVDHGIEDPDARGQAGKNPAGTITVSTTVDADAFTVSVQDDGPGVDWARLRAKAEALGIAVEDLEEPTELLFLSGVSSRSEVTELSGRGVGMSAVAEACRALGGSIEVRSTDGAGTGIRFSFPKDGAVYEGHSAVLKQREAA